MTPLSFLYTIGALSCSLPLFAASTPVDLGKINFLGDSITEMSGCYRESLWKCFIDNGVKFTPVGTSGNGSSGSSYRGKNFINTYDGHSSWRSDHILEGGKGEVSGAGKLSDWITTMGKNGTIPDTVTLMVGINDLAWGKKPGIPTTEDTLNNVGKIVDQYRAANPNVTVHLYSVLDSVQGWQSDPSHTSSVAYNKMLEANVKAGKYGNNVVYHDVTAGFGSTKVNLTGDGVHPNQQGSLVIAGNMAKALGIGSRTVGLERKSTTQLTTHVNFTTGSGVSQTIKANKIQSSGKDWNYTSPTQASLFSGKDNQASLSANWDTTASGGQFSLDLSLQMNTLAEGSNCFSIQLGNGVANDGRLNIYSDKLTWGMGNSNLYLGDLTASFLNLRIVYRNADSTNGIASGYYVWVNDVLVGDARQGDTSSKTDGFIMGDLSNQFSTNATVKDITYDATGAFATADSTKSIPEPSITALSLLGLAGLFLRRRRKAQ
ncbi:MAG: GDSL-type esterase/lipase family protein [Akkermansia sp.]